MNQLATVTCNNIIEVASSEWVTSAGPEIIEADVTVLASEALVDHGYTTPLHEVMKYKLIVAEKEREELQK